ncbi:hypothetical protein EKO27_g7277 [Xylaria grammica]|uniref:Uncharacterized protein n=1 Tax=Xylaria grammica TaxID=363999 RepID=A0A439D090_9PEZI|nr:hypothetical protein EKO27_g7277 [Xylaria grammica]
MRLHTKPSLAFPARELRDEFIRHGRDAADVHNGKPGVVYRLGDVVFDGTPPRMKGDCETTAPPLPIPTLGLASNCDHIPPVPCIFIYGRITTTARQENLQAPLHPGLSKDTRYPLEEQHVPRLSVSRLPSGHARVSQRV